MSILLIAVCLLVLGGCKASEEGNDILNPHFTGKVLEKYEDSCLIEVSDVGNGNFAVGQEVVVHTNIPGCPDFAVGDSVVISFDGKVAYSLPPQVVCVTMIHVNES